MSPNMPTFLGNSTVKMLAIIEYWEQNDGCHLNNTGLYTFLFLCKLGLGMVVLHLCQQKWRSSFLSICALSFIVADAVLACTMVTVWFLGPIRSPVSVCFILAHASAVYAALPVPTIGLGLLDYASGDMLTSRLSPLCKSLCNVVLVLLMWTMAVVYNTGSVTTAMMEIEDLGGAMALVCEVHESRMVSYFVFGLFIYVLLTLLPHYPRLYQWFQEAEKLNQQRNEPRPKLRSDLQFRSVANLAMKDTKSGENNILTEPQVMHRPSLCVSLTLGFASIWMPYLVISVMCLWMGIGIPSYVIVNHLWLECMNSVLTGVVFWLKSDTVGPYNKLTDDMCLCRGYWQLSKGTHQHKLPTAV